MAESENDQESMRRWRRWFREAQERGGPQFHSGGYVNHPTYLVGGGKFYNVEQQPATPRAPSKDWTKIETYWPHLAKQGGAVAPRRGV